MNGLNTWVGFHATVCSISLDVVFVFDFVEGYF